MKRALTLYALLILLAGVWGFIIGTRSERARLQKELDPKNGSVDGDFPMSGSYTTGPNCCGSQAVPINEDRMIPPQNYSQSDDWNTHGYQVQWDEAKCVDGEGKGIDCGDSVFFNAMVESHKKPPQLRDSVYRQELEAMVQYPTAEEKKEIDKVAAQRAEIARIAKARTETNQLKPRGPLEPADLYHYPAAISHVHPPSPGDNVKGIESRTEVFRWHGVGDIYWECEDKHSSPRRYSPDGPVICVTDQKLGGTKVPVR